MAVEVTQAPSVTRTRRTPLAAVPPAIPRGVALFLGAFTLLNFVHRLSDRGFDGNLWWIDLRPAAAWISQPLLGLAGLCLVGYGVGVNRSWFRRIALWTSVGLLGIALANAISYYHLRASGAVYSGPALPFSLLLAGALAVIVLSRALNAKAAGAGRLGRAIVAVTAFACLVGFPVAQVYCFGTTDYRRPADVIVVFGAKAFSNDQPSSALADRVRTGCMLYHEGWAPRLIFSGGPAAGNAHEAECMRRLALRLGVPDAAITLDRDGLSTYDTVRNTTRMFNRMRVHRVIAVSHFFHLPRIKMTYQRAGWNVFTVPVQKPRMPRDEYAFMVLRETAAMWAYYLRLR
jgi:vancomycin permeability regulator SanA